MTTKSIIQEVISLPVEERAVIVDSILRSLNPPDAAMDQKWIEVARLRLNDMKTGQVSSVSGETIFERIWRRFSK